MFYSVKDQFMCDLVPKLNCKYVINVYDRLFQLWIFFHDKDPPVTELLRYE